MKQILVLNSGSSSIKYELFDMNRMHVLESGLLECIGEPESCYQRKSAGRTHSDRIPVAIPNHEYGMQLIRESLGQNESFCNGDFLVGIGHRVVHGGELFSGPTRIDEDVIESIRRLIPLAPLHNPANLLGIEISRLAFPNVQQVAVFDTAFHQTLPRHAYHYAIPREYYQRYQIRRYGFHGTSHHYVTRQVADALNMPLSELNIIVFHLGNGASAAAIRAGKSIDTSMGLTPLEGLVMGTRSGDLDPAVVFYLGSEAGLSLDQIDTLLNKQSGLKGICGVNDMREVLRRTQTGDDLACLAIDLFCYRIKKYLGGYYAVLGRLDAIAFTAGIGENVPQIRQQSCQGLAHIGIELDAQRNESSGPGIREIQSSTSAVKVFVVPTNEELEIAQQTLQTVAAD
ncbi:acetate kinase [Stieleria sp. TO1_6]|uniref:acetate/propionate family kinase n=1 Tax=Stieleria tagensis TaxID=2956795 RepID=UPI00209B856A|nr:acetate kinase [Stieleria tagensis]MCO8120984.1 acetate kinase [Stieleria tagensis]